MWVQKGKILHVGSAGARRWATNKAAHGRHNPYVPTMCVCVFSYIISHMSKPPFLILETMDILQYNTILVVLQVPILVHYCINKITAAVVYHTHLST